MPVITSGLSHQPDGGRRLRHSRERVSKTRVSNLECAAGDFWRSGIILTSLQRGGFTRSRIVQPFQRLMRKPLKRFIFVARLAFTSLKRGVNESFFSHGSAFH